MKTAVKLHAISWFSFAPMSYYMPILSLPYFKSNFVLLKWFMLFACHGNWFLCLYALIAFIEDTFFKFLIPVLLIGTNWMSWVLVKISQRLGRPSLLDSSSMLLGRIRKKVIEHLLRTSRFISIQAVLYSKDNLTGSFTTNWWWQQRSICVRWLS